MKKLERCYYNISFVSHVKSVSKQKLFDCSTSLKKHCQPIVLLLNLGRQSYCSSWDSVRYPVRRGTDGTPANLYKNLLVLFFSVNTQSSWPVNFLFLFFWREGKFRFPEGVCLSKVCYGGCSNVSVRHQKYSKLVFQLFVDTFYNFIFNNIIIS